MFQKRSWAVGFSMILGLSFCVLAGQERGIPPQGSVETGNHESLYTLEGNLHFAGTPLSTQTSVQPSFWFRDESTLMEYTGAIATYNPGDGRYSIANLPAGDIGISIICHVTGSTETLPGNYRGWTSLDVSTLSEAERVQYDIGLQTILHLTSPWDNSTIAQVMGEPYPVHPNQVIFSWDTLPQATTYTVALFTYRDPDHASGYGYIETTIFTEVTTAAYTATLQTSNPDEHYEFTITAYKGSDEIGKYMTTYAAGYGGDYRFKVESGVGVTQNTPDPIQAPHSFALMQNQPNPFNPRTKISFQLSALSGQTTHHSPLVTLKVYNLLGQEVATLADEVKSPGSYTVTWDASDMGSGIYFYRLNAGEYSETRRMVLLR